MQTSIRVTMVACLSTAVVASFTTLGLSRPDAMIERSFARGFDSMGTGDRQFAPAMGAVFDPAHLHLSRLPSVGALNSNLQVGDRITVALREGGTAAYEMVEIRPLGVGEGTSGPGGEISRLSVATAISVGQLPARTIRLLIDVEPQNVMRPGASQHSL
jgi:hypothetical protein